MKKLFVKISYSNLDELTKKLNDLTELCEDVKLIQPAVEIDALQMQRPVYLIELHLQNEESVKQLKELLSIPKPLMKS